MFKYCSFSCAQTLNQQKWHLHTPYIIWCQWCWIPTSINCRAWPHKSCEHMNIYQRTQDSPGINCSLMGKADWGTLCQWMVQCSLEPLMKTQITDTLLVKTGGVHNTVAEPEWSINLQNFPKDAGPKTLARCSGEHFGQVPPWQPSTHHRLWTLLQIFLNCSGPSLLCITCYKIIGSIRVEVATQAAYRISIFTWKGNANNPLYDEAKCKFCFWVEVHMHAQRQNQCNLAEVIGHAPVDNIDL